MVNVTPVNGIVNDTVLSFINLHYGDDDLLKLGVRPVTRPGPSGSNAYCTPK